MKIQSRLSNYFQRLGFWAALFLCACPAQADPISLPEKSVTPEISFLIFFSILLEAICVLLLLRRYRKPRFFVFWIFGMHLLTYPGFLSVLWLLQDIRPAFAATIGEALVVLVEGALIYLICRYLPPKQNLPTALLFKCWLVSLVGNACSLVSFPLLIHLYDLVSRSRI